jgi:hypothetical protein
VCDLLKSLVNGGNLLENIAINALELAPGSPDPRFILFEGLSFGGAIAQAAITLFAEYVVYLREITLNGVGEHIFQNRELNLGLLMFGAPRIGGKEFVKKFNHFYRPGYPVNSIADETGAGLIKAVDHFMLYSHLQVS